MSPKLLLPILILIPLVVLALVFFPSSSSLSSSFGSPASPARLAEAPAKRAGGELTTQNSQPDASPTVTVSVEYLPAGSSADFIFFRVSLNTHSVDLDNIDFQKSVVLEKSGPKLSPIEVATDGSGLPAEASAKAGHHRSAEVKFNRVAPPLKIIFLETPEINRQEFEFNELK